MYRKRTRIMLDKFDLVAVGTSNYLG